MCETTVLDNTAYWPSMESGSPSAGETRFSIRRIHEHDVVVHFSREAVKASREVSCYIITSVPAVTFPRQLETIVYDLRFAWRGLRRDRAYTLTAIAMLTLAIALNVTVFAVMDTILFRGFPLAHRPDRLVYIQERRAAGGFISYADFEDWRTENSHLRVSRS